MEHNPLVQTFQRTPFTRLVFITAGYPDPSATVDTLLAIQKSGVVDVIEVGVPFTDPVGDGPVIAECGRIAREKGVVTLEQCLEFVKQAQAKGLTVPVVLMGYLNTFKPGWAALSQNIISGVIIVDLPYEEPFTHEFVADCRQHKIAFVPICTPLTTPCRLALVDSLADAFVYCTTVTGVTGVRDFGDYFQKEYAVTYREIKASTRHKAIVGFGIGSSGQVNILRNVLKADGCVVGSAVMKKLTEISEKKLLLQPELVKFLQTLFPL